MGTIVIAGGTGFIGRYVRQRFEQDGFTVRIISRGSADIPWSDETRIHAALERADLLLNLAGKSVDCRYNTKNKALILRSRVDTTKQLQRIIDSCSAPPPLWINASTATIYRDAMDRPMDEETGEIGEGFSVDIARKWEGAFFAQPTPAVRKVALRIAIALGRDAGVMVPYTNLVKFGLGGRQGSGKQRFSWIHVEDLYRIIRFVMVQPTISGAINCASPEPVTNTEFMQTLRSMLKPWIALPSPKPILELGAWLIRTETELILKSRWVVPTRLLRAGFRFRYPNLEEALTDLVSDRN